MAVSLRLLAALARIRAALPATDRHAVREAILRGLAARDERGVLRLTPLGDSLCDAHLRAVADD